MGGSGGGVGFGALWERAEVMGVCDLANAYVKISMPQATGISPPGGMRMLAYQPRALNVLEEPHDSTGINLSSRVARN